MLEEANVGDVSFPIEKMWESVDLVNGLLGEMERVHPDRIRKFKRGQHRILFGGHYDECLAMEDVSHLRYTDSSETEHQGAHWTIDQIEMATEGLTFPSDVTRWDKYVAFNAAYSDFCKYFGDEQILQIGYAFYFADEDWKGNDKIWDYMGLNVC